MTIDKKKMLLIAAGVILAVCLCVGIYKQAEERSTPPVTTVPNTSASTLREYFPNLTPADTKDLSNQISRARDTQAPTYVYYTNTQAAADKQAQEYGKQQKADQIVKTTEKKEIKDETGKVTGEVIENDYYAVNLNRKHDIKLGAAAVDQTAYATVSYRNRDIEYTAYYAPGTGVKGAGVSVTVAKW